MATAYKDILVYLDPTAASQERLALAVSLAREHGARLVGVDVSADEAFNGVWSERALRIAPEFEEALKNAALKGRFFPSEPRSTPGAEQMHCVDLIIAPRPAGE